AEDGIRDPLVTGVQTCALPIWFGGRPCAKTHAPPGQARWGRPPLCKNPRSTGASPVGAAALVQKPTLHRGKPGGGGRPCAKTHEIGRASCRERGEVREQGGARR